MGHVLNSPFLQVALNGRRRKAEHSAVPVTAAEMVSDIQQLDTLGVRSVHLHVRDEQGRETLHPEAVADTLNAIRTACPQMELAVSTAEGIAATPQQRLEYIQAWTVWPDTLCVNLAETGIQELIDLAHGRGMALEAGLSRPEDIHLFRELKPLRWRRALLEPPSTDPEGAEQELQAPLSILGTPWLDVPHVIHGMDDATWPLLRRAARITGASRIGFEDVLTLPDGQPAHSNAQLYQAAWRLMQEVPL